MDEKTRSKSDSVLQFIKFYYSTTSLRSQPVLPSPNTVQHSERRKPVTNSLQLNFVFPPPSTVRVNSIGPNWVKTNRVQFYCRIPAQLFLLLSFFFVSFRILTNCKKSRNDRTPDDGGQIWLSGNRFVTVSVFFFFRAVFWFVLKNVKNLE